MFKKLVKRLYEKYYPQKLSVVEMTRLQMLGTPLSPDILDFPDSEKKQIAEEARMLLTSEVLRLAINNVKNRAMKHIQNEAQTAEIIFYDRFTINGACLVEDELRAYADMMFDGGEEFNEHEVY